MRLTTIVALTAALSAIVAPGGRVAAEDTQFRETVTVQGVRSADPGGRDEHLLTFSGPVALPGFALGAGTYVFRRPSTDVLQVLIADGRRPLAMINTIMASRHGPTHAYEVVFRRAARADAPPRIDEWFAAGEENGQQLVYK